jgi:hypothetical protein
MGDNCNKLLGKYPFEKRDLGGFESLQGGEGIVVVANAL